jgi:hypothetical protein
MQSHSAQTRHLPTLAIVILLGLLLLLPGRAWGDSGPSALLAQVYARLAGLDGYAFSATVRQTTHPLPTLANVGLSSETSSISWCVGSRWTRPTDLHRARHQRAERPPAGRHRPDGVEAPGRVRCGAGRAGQEWEQAGRQRHARTSPPATPPPSCRPPAMSACWGRRSGWERSTKSTALSWTARSGLRSCVRNCRPR